MLCDRAEMRVPAGMLHGKTYVLRGFVNRLWQTAMRLLKITISLPDDPMPISTASASSVFWSSAHTIEISIMSASIGHDAVSCVHDPFVFAVALGAIFVPPFTNSPVPAPMDLPLHR